MQYHKLQMGGNHPSVTKQCHEQNPNTQNCYSLRAIPSILLIDQLEFLRLIDDPLRGVSVLIQSVADQNKSVIKKYLLSSETSDSIKNHQRESHHMATIIASTLIDSVLYTVWHASRRRTEITVSVSP